MSKDILCLNPPTTPRVRYSHNFLKNAVCELRFPTQLELETKPPTVFQAKIRKLYPHFEHQVIEQVGAPDALSQEVQYLFRSKDRKWTIGVKSSSISIETSSYVDFEDFYAKINQALLSARELIDSDFFTRVGLRYINQIPIDGDTPEDWIAPQLIRPVIDEVLGYTQSYASSIQGYLEDGSYSFRHGFKRDNPDSPLRYTLDFDYYEEGVEIGEVERLLKSFNEKNFSFFSWCLGEKAKAYLGEGKPK